MKNPILFHPKKGELLPIMIDIETLATVPGAVVLSIGAVLVDRPDQRFHVGIDLLDSLELGGIVDPATAGWWKGHREAWCSEVSQAEETTVAGAMTALAEWIERQASAAGVKMEAVRFWSKGAFDYDLLEWWFHRVLRAPAPWRYWQIRDYRTWAELHSDFPLPDLEPGDVAHGALADAKRQAKHMRLAMVRRERERVEGEVKAEG